VAADHEGTEVDLAELADAKVVVGALAREEADVVDHAEEDADLDAE